MTILRHITTQLLLLVLAVAAPLSAMIGYLIYTDAREAEGRAIANVREIVRDVAEDSDASLLHTIEHMEYLSKQPAVRFADPARCNPLIVELQRMNASLYSVIVVARESGDAVCWSLDRSTAGASYADREWFRSGMKSTGFRAATPILGRFTGELVVPLTLPLTNDKGRTVGVLSFATSLHEISTRVEAGRDLPRGSVITVVGREGIVVARSLDPDKWLGQDGRAIPAIVSQLEKKEGIETLIDIDGVARIFAFITMPRTGWLVSAGIPVEAVTAGYRTKRAHGILAAVLATSVVLGVAFLWAYRIRKPIRSLADSARAIGRGEFGARALETGPVEIVAVAREFNRMNEVRAKVEAEARVLAVSRYARNLIEASLDPMMTISPEGKITDVNEATAKATGIPREGLVGTDFSDYFTEPQRARSGYREVFEKGFVTDYPLTIRHRDGRLIDVLYNASVYRDEVGGVLGVFAAARDVTELKRAEASARSLAAIVESSDDAIISATSEGRISTWNAGAERLYGYRAEEIIGRPILTLVPAERASEESGILDRVRAGEHVSHYATVRLRKDGSPVEVSLMVSPVRNEAGTIVGISKTARDITERRRLEREREQYFRFFTLSNDAMCIADPFGCFKRVNPAFMQLTGFDEGELVSRPFLEFVLPEDRQRTADEMKLQVAVRPSMDFENRYVRKDGSVILLSWTAYFDKSDGVTYAAARDITERRRNEEVLRASEARFKVMFNDAPLGIALIDSLTGRIHEVNPMFAKIAGRTIGEMATIDWMSITHPDDVQKDLDNMALLNAGKIPGFQMEKRYLRPDGTVVNINMTIAPMYVEDKAHPRHLCMIEDITERKRAEAKLRMAGLYARSLIEASLDPLVTISSEGKITDVNEATVNVTGVPREKLIGSDFSNYFTQPQQARSGYREVFEKGLVTDYPLTIRHADGRLTDVLYNASVYRDEAGAVLGVFAAARDVTERKRAEAGLHELNATLERRVRERTAQLEAANKELEAFSYSASHDLRAPLNTINGFSRALQEDYGDKLDADGKDYLQRLCAASQRMAQLVDDLLKLSRMTRADMVQEPVDLSVIARTVADELRANDPAREVAIDIAPDVRVRGDRRLLGVVLENLLGNAWKFTSKRPRARIEFGVTERDGERVYYVRDDGAGFDMTHVDKLFVPFQRLHAASDFPGNGVGLATVRRIVVRHGGRVWAEGKLEKGATFYFTIPDALAVKSAGTPGSL